MLTHSIVYKFMLMKRNSLKWMAIQNSIRYKKVFFIIIIKKQVDFIIDMKVNRMRWGIP